MARTFQGQNHTWQVDEAPIGSGDAGEVYTVACVDQPELQGMLKKPARIATGGTIQRQAGQIAQESQALAILDGLPHGKAHPPRLLDEALPFTQGTANYFIVSEAALGKDMATLLSDYRQKGKPFPQRVIITVLDALFDLFSRAHKAGVLWNDVKLDHIYWHNPTGNVAVIDWGNAYFLERENNAERRALPRWEDYRQMVETLGGFLRSSAPELYADLGWDEFEGQALDRPRISVLARRIAYQQEVVALKVMEYQSLMRVIMQDDPSLEGLEKILSYHKNLEQIGAPLDQTSVKSYSQSLVMASLSKKERQKAVRATTLVWQIFGDSLALPWHLLREYFRNADILAHHSLELLVEQTFGENWAEAVWQLMKIANEIGEKPWWTQLVPVMRQNALSTVTPTPYQTCQSLATGAKTPLLQNQFNAFLQGWRQKGQDRQESPLDYAFLDLIRARNDLPGSIRTKVKQSFAAGEAAIRELSSLWAKADFESLPSALKQVAVWDPDRWGILTITESIKAFSEWRDVLFRGPASNDSLHSFLTNMIETRPKLEIFFGEPAWLKNLNRILMTADSHALSASFNREIEKWCPWLLRHPDLSSDIPGETPPDEETIQESLQHFIGHLKNWSNLSHGLSGIKSAAPEYYPFCQKLADRFQSVFMLSQDLPVVPIDENSPHPVLDESWQGLTLINHWRCQLEENHYSRAFQVLDNPIFQNWRIIEHAKTRTEHWVKHVLPVLTSIATFESQQNHGTTETPYTHLIYVANACDDLLQAWGIIYKTGLNQLLMENIEDTIVRARSRFLKWRQAYEQSSDPVDRLLYHHQLDLIRQVSNNYLRLVEHSRQAKLNFTILTKTEGSTPSTKLSAMKIILEHLGMIESILIADAGKHAFPGWQTAFQEIYQSPTAEERRQMVLSLSDNNPLYTWLVESVFA